MDDGTHHDRHPKQCRRITMRKRREVWVSVNDYENALAGRDKRKKGYTDCAVGAEPDPGDGSITWLRFIETKRR